LDLTKHVKPIVAEVKKNEEEKIVPPVTLNEYSYYESGKKHVKVLITLNGIEKHPKEKIKVDFKQRSFEVLILDMNGKNYLFKVPKLQCKIKPEQSTFSFKTNTIVITLFKEKEDDHWWSLFKTKAVCEADSD